MAKEAKLIRIGNSQGIRLTKKVISKYGLGERVLLIEQPDGILIRAATPGKLSWEDTYKAMANEAVEEHAEWADWQELDNSEESHL